MSNDSATREQGAPERIYTHPASAEWHTNRWPLGEDEYTEYVHGDRHAAAIEVLRGVAIMLNTELKRYKDEPWAKAVAAALHPE